MRVLDLCGLDRTLAGYGVASEPRPTDVNVGDNVEDRRIGALFSDLRIALGCEDDDDDDYDLGEGWEENDDDYDLGEGWEW